MTTFLQNRRLQAWPLLFLLTPAVAFAKPPSQAAQRWWSHVEVLGADDMEGRDTGSPGHQKAAEYVAAQFKQLGIEPGVGDSYFQEVPLLSRRLMTERSRLALVRDGKEQPLTLEHGMLSPLTGRAGKLDAGIVFVGYGLRIPEAGHDDLAGLDVKGKLVVALLGASPPGVANNLASHAGSLEERSRAYAAAGAAGVIAVYHPRTSELPWDRLVESQRMPAMMLAEPALQDVGQSLVFVLASAPFVETLFEGSGHTFKEVLALADQGKPLPHVTLPGTLRGEVALEQKQLTSVNVVGRIPGGDAARASESVVLSAHLDHVGIVTPVNGDSICNGVMDNAIGVATMLEVGRALKAQKAPPQRSVVIAVVTAEEKGMLGSRWFAAHPPEGTGTMVANLNVDLFLPVTPFKRVVAFGEEESTLAAPLRAAAKRVGVQVMKDPFPEQNFFVRSDQYHFVLKGVPALAFSFGHPKGSAGEKLETQWVQERYHGTTDDLAQPMNREAAAHFVAFITELTRRVADAPQRPTWNAKSFFRRYAEPTAAKAQP